MKGKPIKSTILSTSFVPLEKAILDSQFTVPVVAFKKTILPPAIFTISPFSKSELSFVEFFELEIY